MSKEYRKKNGEVFSIRIQIIWDEKPISHLFWVKPRKSPKICHLWRLRSPWSFMRFMHIAHHFYSLGRVLSIYNSFGTFPAHFRLVSAGATCNRSKNLNVCLCPWGRMQHRQGLRASGTAHNRSPCTCFWWRQLALSKSPPDILQTFGEKWRFSPFFTKYYFLTKNTTFLTEILQNIPVRFSQCGYTTSKASSRTMFTGYFRCSVARSMLNAASRAQTHIQIFRSVACSSGWN